VAQFAEKPGVLLMAVVQVFADPWPFLKFKLFLRSFLRNCKETLPVYSANSFNCSEKGGMLHDFLDAAWFLSLT